MITATFIFDSSLFIIRVKIMRYYYNIYQYLLKKKNREFKTDKSKI